MLEALFISVLNMSLIASFVIAFVLIARLLLKKVPKIFAYALWGIVLFRLLCPFSFESVISLLPFRTSLTPQNILYSQTPTIDIGIPAVNSAINAVLPVPNLGDSVNPMQIIVYLCAIVWVIGILAMLIYGTISFVKLKKSLVGATPLKDSIYLADHIVSPFVMGLFRPKIYLPSFLTMREQDFIIDHEVCHVRRLDHITRILGFAALAIHWFNPLVWVAFILSGKDMEISCDEAVMKKMNNDIRTEYSQSLLCFSTVKKMIHATPLAFGEGDTKGRVKNVLNYKKPEFWVIVVSVIAVVAVGIGLLANPKEKPTGFAGINATILEIDKANQIMTVAGRDENSTIGDKSIIAYEGADLLTLATNSGPKNISIDDFSVGDTVILFIGEIQETYPTSATATTIQLARESLEEPLNEMRPMIMVDGILYLDTNKAVSEVIDDSAVLGEVSSSLSGSKKPTENGQTNFSAVGAKYAAYGSDIVIWLNNKWIVFEKAPFEEILAAKFETIMSSPMTSSNPYEYIKAHKTTFDEIVSYGNDTLIYCFSLFEQGNQTGLAGHIMMFACREIQTESENDIGYETGQLWYDAFKVRAMELKETTSKDELDKHYPTYALLLDLLDGAESLFFWVKPDESPQVIGNTAATIWLNSFMGENVPDESRISSYTITDVTVITGEPKAGVKWEDMAYQYVVRVTYDITTAAEQYLSPSDGISQKGTFRELFRELCVKVKLQDGGGFLIVDVGTGGAESEFLTD